MKKLLLTIFFMTLIRPIFSQWLEPQTLRNTILLEKEEGGIIIPHGTGFLFYNYKEPSKLIVVTCAHLLKNSSIYVSVNADSAFLVYTKNKNIRNIIGNNLVWQIVGNRIRAKVDLYKNNLPVFAKHDSLDIAAFVIESPNMEIVIDSTIKFKTAKSLAIPQSMILFRKDLQLGDETYFIGFPFGIGTDDSVNPLVRSGSIAWFSTTTPFYLLDAFSYNGNSGSPVFLKTILGPKLGDLSWNSSKLIGMIIGHYYEGLNNILVQPNPKELKFEIRNIESNDGLAICVWMDDIMQVIGKLEKIN